MPILMNTSHFDTLETDGTQFEQEVLQFCGLGIQTRHSDFEFHSSFTEAYMMHRSEGFEQELDNMCASEWNNTTSIRRG